MKKILFVLLLFAFMPLLAEEVKEDHQYIYTTRTWGEFTMENQRLLLFYFDNMLTKELQQLGVPSFWNKEAETTLLADQKRFTHIVNNTHIQAENFATNQNIKLDDLLPTGFLMGLGVTGSGDFIAGMGASALLTLVVVPLEIETFDKTTNQTTQTYEASWAIGGIGQGSVGAGVGAGLSVRGALGLIWGHLPDANQLKGTAVGVGGSIAEVEGLGFKAAVLFNSSSQNSNPTSNPNVIALATYDMGIAKNANVDGEIFYFLDADQVVQFLSGTPLTVYKGVAIINSTMLQEPF